MELHPDETLATRIHERGALALDEAQGVVRQLLAGVGAAHAADADLKPSNVLLTGARAVVTDFGLCAVRVTAR